MSSELQNKHFAIIAKDGFEEAELTSPRQAILDAGGTVDVISDETGEIAAFNHFDRAGCVPVDKSIDQVSADDYHGLVIPGGLFSPDAMRTDERYTNFARAFFEQKKPVASICHGPQVLISADLVKGRKMTAVEAVRPDLSNAGADVVDEAVIVDEGLVTSRTPDDLDAFNMKLVEEFCEGKHAGQTAVN